jgi:hypothetical protein
MGLIHEKTRGEKSLLSPRIEIEDVTEICKPLRGSSVTYLLFSQKTFRHLNFTVCESLFKQNYLLRLFD